MQVNRATPDYSPAHTSRGTRSKHHRLCPCVEEVYRSAIFLRRQLHSTRLLHTDGRSEVIAPFADCGYVVSVTVSLPSPGYFSPFPHGTMRYRWMMVFSLGGWAPQFPAGFLVSRGTRASEAEAHPATFLRGSHPLGPVFPDRSVRRLKASEVAAATSPLCLQPRLPIGRPAMIG